MRCFKYMSFETFTKSVTGSGLKLRLSKPSDFNDPFDSTGEVTGYLPIELADKYLDSIGYARIQHLPYIQAIAENLKFEDGRKLTSENKRIGIATLWIKKMVSSRRLFDNFCRILCLAKEESEIKSPQSASLMWSHYARDAKGVRLTLDLGIVPFFPLHDVEYCDQLPKINLSTIRDLPDLDAFYKKCLFNKARAWEYENEVRIVFTIKAMENNPQIFLHEREEDKNPDLPKMPGVDSYYHFYYLLLPPEALYCVDYGNASIVEVNDFPRVMESASALGLTYKRTLFRFTEKNYVTLGYDYYPLNETFQTGAITV